AWVGSFPEQPSLEMRVEAAAWRGRPVYFEITGPWAPPERGTEARSISRRMEWMTNILLFAIFFLGGTLAWRNSRQGRSDRKGAFRLTVFVFLGPFVAAMVGSPAIFINLAICFLFTGVAWLAYLGLEPYVRRRWPTMLISWSRALAGNFRDPLVGRD